MNKIEAFSPAHITGLFVTENNHVDLKLIGSKGAGVSLTLGVYTTVWTKKSSRRKKKIYINNKPAKAKVSSTLIEEFFKLIQEPYEIIVNHKVEVPIGAGYGTSGAGALSLALALNESLNAGLSKIEAAQLAHIAEIKCKTGLGTVLAETFGGIELRDKAGAPGVGSVRKIADVDSKFKVVSFYLNKLPTKNFLTNPNFCRKINIVGSKFFRKLVEKPSVNSFLNLSRKFADSLNMYTPKLKNLLKMLDDYGLNFTMNMFGEAVFSLIKEEELQDFLKKTSFWKNFGQIIISGIDSTGARLVG